nr:hypothetical protein [Sinorhizobium sp. LM21]
MSPESLEFVFVVFSLVAALLFGVFGFKAIDHFGQNRDWWV